MTSTISPPSGVASPPSGVASAALGVATMATPIGPFTMLADDDGAILASGFTEDIGTLLPQVNPALLAGREPRARSGLGPATGAVTAYFDGDLAIIDTIEVRQPTEAEFLAAAWAALRTVAPGHPVSYATFAALAGRPAAVRAAARACARNAAGLFVPCHRVLRSDGSLGGYRWGAQVKRFLLDHERSG